MSVKTIQPDEARSLQVDGVQLIDVRDEPEWKRGHPHGAIHRPLNQLDFAEFGSDQPLMFICASGGRSLQAARMASAAGLDSFNLLGGVVMWEALGHPMSTD